MKPRVGLAAQIVVGREQQIEEAREIFLGEIRGLICEARAFVDWGGDEIGVRAAHARDEKIAKMADCFAAEVLEVLAVGDEAVNEAERTFGGLGCDRIDQIVKHAFGDDAEKFADLQVCDGVAAIGDGLFEQRKSVAETAFGCARENGDGAGIDGEIFGFRDAFDFTGNFLKRESAKLKKLRARFDRLDEIFGSRGGENENDALGRLFQSFQQRVRGFVGELMRFVEDHDFVAARSGRVTDHFAKFADLVDAAIGGGVNFENVERIAGGNFAAGIAGAVRLGGGTGGAIERLRQDAGGGRFADAANAGKNVRMRDAVRLNRIRERARDVLLPDDVAERLRAILSGYDFVAHGRFLFACAFCAER